jgi:hypothetical protein
MDPTIVCEELLVDVLRYALDQPGFPPVPLGGIARVAPGADGCNWKVWWVQVRDGRTEMQLDSLVAPLRTRFLLDAPRCPCNAPCVEPASVMQ